MIDKTAKKRNFILNSNLWRVVTIITLPLALYGFFNFIYSVIDILLVPSNSVAGVGFLDEVKNTINAFVVGLAIGGSVIVARHYGANDLEKARKTAGETFALGIYVSFFLTLVTIILGKQLLILLQATPEMIANSYDYYIIQMFTIAVTSVNTIFIALERVKGNTTKILILNVLAMILKIIISLIFFKIFMLPTAYAAISTLIAQGALMVFACFSLFKRTNIFKVKISDFKITKKIIMPVILISIPVFFGKFIFSVGKVIVNSLATTFFGAVVVHAFIVSNRMPGVVGSVANSFEDSTPNIVSANLGNNNANRARKTYIVSLTLSLIVGLIGFLLIHLFLTEYINLMAQQPNQEEFLMITNLFKWEKYSIITNAVAAINVAFFIGYKRSSMSMVLNITRLFVLRIPILLIGYYSGLGYLTIGYAMFISNLATALLGIMMVFIFIIRQRRYERYGGYPPW